MIDLPTIQRYLNFHFSVTIDLFGADESSNAATFYSTGLKGRFEEGKRSDDHVLQGPDLQGARRRQDGQLVEREVPMLNALNEVLRDDYIKDSVGGVERWNKVIEKAGIPFRLKVPHKAFHRNIGALAGVKVVARRARGQRSRVEGQRRPVAALRRRPRLRRQPDGPRGRAGQVRQLDRAAGDGHQPPAGRLRVRAVQLKPNETGHGHGRPTSSVIKQHLIDPEICIRCNTCEATCPVGAITHDSRNYVVDAAKCNLCMDCISPCPTGSIDNWRTMPLRQGLQHRGATRLGRTAGRADVRASWPSTGVVVAAEPAIAPVAPPLPAAASGETSFNSAQYGATVPPWSAAHAYTNLYGPKAAEKTITATVVGNVRVTEVGREYDTHHIMLDFGTLPFPVLEGQSIGIIPPGTDANGPAAPCAPVLDRQPAQRRAAGLQQPVADHQARAGRPPGQAGARRRQQLHVRPEGRRQGAGDRPVRRAAS